jgi:GH43 family beta-xylosidase
MRSQRIGSGILALGLAFYAYCAHAVTAHEPVLDVDFPDPFILPVDGALVAYATNARIDGKRVNIQFSHSADGLRWSHPVDAMPEVPAWARSEAPDIWAPEVIRIGNRYALYFSARHKTLKRPDGLTLCVGVAMSDSPAGPFKPAPEPLTCGDGLGVIDASPMRDGDNLWLYVKTDGNCCGVPITILAQKLSKDGTALVGEPVIVPGVTNDKAWEGDVVEGEQMIANDGRYFMVFAANDYGSDKYATGYAVCETPVGPCHDAEENPILKSDNDLVGPGHQSVFTFEGRMWIAYHAWRCNGGSHRRYRAMYIDHLDWGDGGLVVRK